MVARQVLSLRPKADPAPGQPANDSQVGAEQGGDAQLIISYAIARARCLEGRYNSGRVVLQPCGLYREHGALFLLAVTAMRDCKPPRERKLGTFRLAGLLDLRPMVEGFVRGELHRGWTVKESWDVIASCHEA